MARAMCVVGEGLCPSIGASCALAQDKIRCNHTGGVAERKRRLQVVGGRDMMRAAWCRLCSLERIAFT